MSMSPAMTKVNHNNVLITNEMHNSYNKFYFYSTVFALHVSNESSRSSSYFAVLLTMNE
jgi:hypothetical protein